MPTETYLFVGKARTASGLGRVTLPSSVENGDAFIAKKLPALSLKLCKDGLRKENVKVLVVDFGPLTAGHDPILKGRLELEEGILSHHGRILE